MNNKQAAPDDPCEWNGRILSKFHEFVNIPNSNYRRCIKCKKEYLGNIAESAPAIEEAKVELPPISDGAIREASYSNLPPKLKERERQLLESIARERKLEEQVAVLEGYKINAADYLRQCKATYECNIATLTRNHEIDSHESQMEMQQLAERAEAAESRLAAIKAASKCPDCGYELMKHGDGLGLSQEVADSYGPCEYCFLKSRLAAIESSKV